MATTIDCGGTLFKTMRSTLEKSNVLKMLLSRHTTLDPLFLDEDPKRFAVLLDVLRSLERMREHKPKLVKSLVDQYLVEMPKREPRITREVL